MRIALSMNPEPKIAQEIRLNKDFGPGTGAFLDLPLEAVEELMEELRTGQETIEDLLVEQAREVAKKVGKPPQQYSFVGAALLGQELYQELAKEHGWEQRSPEPDVIFVPENDRITSYFSQRLTRTYTPFLKDIPTDLPRTRKLFARLAKLHD